MLASLLLYMFCWEALVVWHHASLHISKALFTLSHWIQLSNDESNLSLALQIWHDVARSGTSERKVQPDLLRCLRGLGQQVLL